MLKKIASLVWLAALLPPLIGAEPEKSVIQIVTFSQQPLWDTPWRFDSVRRSGGSGFVIRGRRIMTNAHVVSWAKQIQVRRYQDPRPYLARAVFIGHDCDLALLEVEDDSFFAGLESLDIGDLPKVRSAVVTYGYPAGGEQISYTRGVVSRIEMQSFTHSGNRAFLAAQTDAAINPGNSGGPVIQEDKVVGVAFQGIPGLENTGFFIPPPVIGHFLRDVEDGTYDGFPQAGLRITTLQNPAYRRYLNLPDNQVGAIIDFVFPYPETRQLIQPDDVLMQVGPHVVGSDASILYQGNRVHAATAFSEAQNGASLPVKVWRKGQALDLSLPMRVHREDAAEGNQYVLPRYLVYAGLVFTPLSRDYYFRAQGGAGPDADTGDLYYELFLRRMETPAQWRPEPVVLATILADPVNANLGIRGRALVDKINGVRIEKMEDVARAFEQSSGAYDVIEFVSHHGLECLDRKAAQQAHAEILKTYSISKDRRL